MTEGLLKLKVIRVSVNRVDSVFVVTKRLNNGPIYGSKSPTHIKNIYEHRYDKMKRWFPNMRQHNLLTCECHTRRALGNTTFKGHGLNVKTAKAHDICVVKEKVKHMRTYVSLIKCRLMAINVRAYSNISILCDIIEDLLYWLTLKLC